jgi:cytochrome c-type biogenesis protein CcmF
MVVELGHYALILALLLAAAQAFFGLAGPALGRERWLAAVPSAATGQFVFLVLAAGVLINAFVQDDFSVRYVAENSNSALPLFYRVTALWGAHEGSLLLWVVVLGAWTMAVVARLRFLPPLFGSRVLGVLGLISFGFLLFTLCTSDPFTRLNPAVPDGNDLNPVLQDFALAVHPPILYTGYVGFAVSFAFACAAMIEGRRDQLWARWMRPWTVIAWAFLGWGIALGSWWAYYELGWGGFWFWDPVENASFMPWLVGTALIHSIAVTDKRGLFKSWTLLLAVAAFSLSLLGTFLVRSGVLVSVHSFAADPRRGIFILVFLIVMIGGALVLYAWRAPRMISAAGFELVSRESFLLFNNLLLVIAAMVVFGGTMAPLIASTFGLYTHPLPLTPIGATLGFWIILSSLIDPLNRLRRRLRVPAAIAGMTLAHIGLGMFVVGITFVQSNTIERDVALKPGQSVQLSHYLFRYDGVESIEGPNYEGVRGMVTVTRDGKPVTVLRPEKRRFWVQGSVQTTAAIAPGLSRDLLVALGDDVGAGAYSLRFQYRPLIRFIWLGALIMAIGGVTVVVGRRQRGGALSPVTQPLGLASGAGRPQ